MASGWLVDMSPLAQTQAMSAHTGQMARTPDTTSRRYRSWGCVGGGVSGLRDVGRDGSGWWLQVPAEHAPEDGTPNCTKSIESRTDTKKALTGKAIPRQSRDLGTTHVG